MGRGQDGRRLVRVLLGVVVGLTVSGCDYWPPALQTQIEQLQTEVQILTTEKAQLEAQVTDLSKTRHDLQFQLDELSRVNQEKSTIITNLQNQVQAKQQKSLKAKEKLSPGKSKPSKAPTSGYRPPRVPAIR